MTRLGTTPLGTTTEQRRPRRRIDPTGNVPTPTPLAEWLCRRAMRLWRSHRRGARIRRRPRVLDPAVGDGVFPLAMRGLYSDANGLACHGMDIRPEAVRHARRSLPGGKISLGNFLLDDPPGPLRYDIIIGNPPYLGQRDVTRLDCAADLYDRFGLKDDLYVYFLLRSLDLLDDGGVLAMVTSDSWLTLAGKEPVRRALLGHKLDHIVRLPSQTFDRRINACCFALVKDRPADKVWYLDASSDPNGAGPLDLTDGQRVRQSAFNRAPGAIIFDPSPANLRLNRVVGGTITRWQTHADDATWRSGAWRPGDMAPLRAIASISDVGIHSRNCRHRLFHAEKTRPGLQRLLQGRQIERWRVRWDAPKARYRWVDVDYRPRPGVKGRGRSGRPSLRDEYWDFQGDPAIHHLPERILIRQTGDDIVAAYLAQDGLAHYTDNTLFTCLLTERAVEYGLTYRYLLAYLNSAPARQIYRFLSQERARRQAQIKVGLLRLLLFRLPGRSEIERVDRIAGEIIRVRHDGRGGEIDSPVAACDDHFRAILDLH